MYGYTGIGMSQGVCVFGHAPGDYVQVGQKEIAARLRVAEETVQKWRTRGLLPDPLPWLVGGRPAWQWGTIRRWAVETDRLPPDEMRVAS